LYCVAALISYAVRSEARTHEVVTYVNQFAIAYLCVIVQLWPLCVFIGIQFLPLCDLVVYMELKTVARQETCVLDELDTFE
jgi:hypothetical protein